MESIGQNIQMEVKDGKLLLEIDLAAKGVPSASGKTIVLASTRGNLPVTEGVFLGLNVYRPK